MSVSTNSTKSKFYTQTDYPDLYGGRYWGNHRGKEHPEIIANRNRFVKDYNISIVGFKEPQYVSKHIYEFPEDKGNRFDYCDHPEVYKTTDRHYIIIVSPHGCHDKCIENGFVEIYPMYSNSTKTYMKKISMDFKTAEPMMSDKFWYNLGRRHCKLKTYVDYLTINKSSRIAKHSKTLKNRLIHLASALDDIVCDIYPRDVHCLETIESKPRITSVFYNLFHFNRDKDAMIQDDGSFLKELEDYLEFVGRLNLYHNNDKVNKEVKKISKLKITKGFVSNGSLVI